jgi:hypothetical protein
MIRHLTRHGSRDSGDALDLFVGQRRLLRDIVQDWAKTRPDGDGRVDEAWKHGTLGKLLVEHTAVRFAARDDIVRVLRSHELCELAERLDTRRPAIADALDRLALTARGVAPIPLSSATNFDETAEELRGALGDELGDDEVARRLTDALGGHRGELRSSRSLQKRAPTHPGTRRRWYHRVPLVQRVHAAYDRLRGFPWAESSPIADPGPARRFDPNQ